MPARPSFGQVIHRFEKLETTMLKATTLAEADAPEGTVVIAEQQTAGRGRLGRSWISEPGVGLYFSIVLRPPMPAAQSAILTLAIGLGVARGIGEACGRLCDIRWPNDVLLDGKKCSGILVEMAAEDERVRYAVAGVGINVNQAQMPAALADTATSLRIETGGEYVREVVLDKVLRNSERYYEMFLERGPRAIVNAFSRASSYARGKRVAIETGKEVIVGTTDGLDDAGVLLLKRDDGSLEPILAGSVRPWDESANS